MPLFDPKKLTIAQQAVYETVSSKLVPWAEAAGFQAKLDDGKLVGPFNTILLSPEIANSFLALQASEQEHTSLSERVRQVVILTVGAVWKCDYERYAHAAVARKVGFSEEIISALAEGTDVEGLSAAEQLAQRVTWQLTAERRLSAELYSEAVSVLGARGIVDLIFLAGCYLSISALLNAFQVPVPQ
ncbi:hypothetical protein PAMC26577_37395 [Caballeronia sordidicola]|uniref:Carboxymuconolactone decarboxylase-like domain-containing protein n=1 Tax=Caballeronia sordidicola TaxID=196367 RepID=A0A242M5Y3_CABSO|nr:hypothetical protein PAMC26577_37395 [Caballeronia sordidicola]